MGWVGVSFFFCATVYEMEVLKEWRGTREHEYKQRGCELGGQTPATGVRIDERYPAHEPRSMCRYPC